MPGRKLSWHQCQEALDAFTQYGTQNEAAKMLRIPRTTFQTRLQTAMVNGHIPGSQPESKPAEFSIAPLPQPDLPIDQLIDHRIRQFARKQAFEDSRRLIPVKIQVKGPIGIWHFGDPHIDDDGTDLAALKHHTDLVRKTPGLFGANVGDTTNNWIGRLARLWSQQSTSHTQAWDLAEWFLRRVDWLYLIGGNHDAWSGSGDPIKWIQRGRSAPYTPSEVRLELRFPNKNVCRINARHDFAGHSQYNPAHGPMKATLFGIRDHISVAGHRHISATGVLKNPEDGSLCHSFLVAGYKLYDRFAMERGFRDQHIAPGVFTLIDPRLPNTDPDFVTHYWTIEKGIDILTYLRKGIR